MVLCTLLCRKPQKLSYDETKCQHSHWKTSENFRADHSLRFYIQFSSVQSLSRVRLCNPMKCSTPGLPVHHQLPEFTQTHVHRVSDVQTPVSCILSSPSTPRELVQPVMPRDPKSTSVASPDHFGSACVEPHPRPLQLLKCLYYISGKQ